MSTFRRVNSVLLTGLGFLLLVVAVFVSPFGEAVDPANYPPIEKFIVVLLAVGCLGTSCVVLGRHRLTTNTVAFAVGTAATAFGSVASLDHISAKVGLLGLAMAAFLVAVLKPSNRPRDR